MEAGERWTIGEDNDVFVIGSGDCVAKVCGAPEGIKKSKGRAQIIAAAPDLLAAAESALAFLEQLGYHGGGNTPTANLIRAIAKAREAN